MFIFSHNAGSPVPMFFRRAFDHAMIVGVFTPSASAPVQEFTL